MLAHLRKAPSALPVWIRHASNGSKSVDGIEGIYTSQAISPILTTDILK